MSEEFSDSAQTNRDGEKRGAGHRFLQRLVVPFGVVLLLAAGVVGGFCLATETNGGKDASTVEIARAYWSEINGENKPDPGLAMVYVDLEPLVTNLRASANGRLLQLSLTLRTFRKDEPAVKEMKSHIRDLVILYLRTLDENDLQGSAAMIAFKEAISHRIAAVDPNRLVQDVYVDQFVVQ